MKIITSNKQASILLLLFFCLCYPTASLLAQDGWGNSFAPSEPPAKKLVSSTKETTEGNKVTYEVWVENVSKDTILAYNLMLDTLPMFKNVKSTPAAKLDIKLNPSPAIKIYPGSSHTLVTVRADSSLKKPARIYWYRTLNPKANAAGMPVLDDDYAIYTEVDTVKMEARYYLQNFSSKAVRLQQVTENGFQAVWISHGESAEPSYVNEYKWSDKPVSLAPGKRIMVWKDRLNTPDLYEVIELQADVAFEE